jgi:hypothetical protein
MSLTLAQINSGASSPPIFPSQNPNSTSVPSRLSLLNIPGSTPHRSSIPRPSITTKFRPDGTHYRPITPLEAIYYHERLDLVTHPLIKGLITWKWDNYAAKHFYLGLLLEVIFLILWTCTALISPFPVRYVYRFPQDIWRCILWAVSISFLLWSIVREIYDISYARKRYEDYLIWERERTKNRLDLISKNKYKSNTNIQSTNIALGKTESVSKTEHDMRDAEHATINETTATTGGIASNLSLPPMRSHHSQHHPLPATIPTVIKGKLTEPLPNQQQPIDAPINSSDPSNIHFKSSSRKSSRPSNTPLIPEDTPPEPPSRFIQIIRRLKTCTKARFKSYYMYYSLNNLFDWIVYMLCLITVITHFVDVGSHTVTRARIHMYIASVTVICIWFRFMVFFRTIVITAKTLRSKLVEIKLGELVIMVRFKRKRRIPLFFSVFRFV